MATTFRITEDIKNIATNQSLVPTGSYQYSCGDIYDAGMLVVGTTEETYTIHTDTANGTTNAAHLCWLKNHDTTNFVELGFGSGYPLKLLPGMTYRLGLNDTLVQLSLKADTAPCNVEFKIYKSA